MKRTLLSLLFALAAMHAAPLLAQAYPNKPIRLVVGYSPAGAADVIARIVGDAMARQLGQPVNVDNKPGAGSTLASDILARAPADGYTLGLATATLYGIDQHLYKVKYKPGDFTPVTRFTISPLILAINKDLGPKNVQELVAYLKANPGKLNYASSGIGGSPHIGGLTLERLAGSKMIHIPFKGGSPALQSVASGDVQLSFGTAPSVLPLGQQGLVRMLAVSTAQRSAVAPDLPTIAESGLPGFEFTFWFGLFGPAGMPREITDKLFAVATRVLADPQVKARLLAGGNEAAPSRSPAEFNESATADGRNSLERIVQAGVKVE
jgi:tripartite-type tricarboxylate transporter receptor subunit TctC